MLVFHCKMHSSLPLVLSIFFLHLSLITGDWKQPLCVLIGQLAFALSY